MYQALVLSADGDCQSQPVEGHWVPLAPVSGEEPLQVWANSALQRSGRTVKVRVKLASGTVAPVNLWLGATAQRTFVNEWVLDAGAGECHATMASAQSIPKVTSKAERLATMPLEVGRTPVTQWAIFNDCTIDPSTGPASIRLRMAFTSNGQFTEVNFATDSLR